MKNEKEISEVEVALRERAWNFVQGLARQCKGCPFAPRDCWKCANEEPANIVRELQEAKDSRTAEHLVRKNGGVKTTSRRFTDRERG